MLELGTKGFLWSLLWGFSIPNFSLTCFFMQASLEDYEETVRKAKEAWKVWADVSYQLRGLCVFNCVSGS